MKNDLFSAKTVIVRSNQEAEREKLLRNSHRRPLCWRAVGNKDANTMHILKPGG